MRLSTALYCILLCSLWLAAGARADAVVVSPAQPTTELTASLLLFEDINAALPVDLPDPTVVAEKLQPWRKNAANFGFSDAAYWVSFTLSNPTDTDIPLVIRQDYPLIDHLDFWWPGANGQWQHVRTGDHEPFGSRPLALRDFVFPVILPANSSHTYYLRYASGGSVNIGLSFSSQEAYLPRLGVEQLLYGIYYGGFLVLVIYNLFLFLALRDPAYAYYMGYSISYGLYFAVINGFAFQFAWPNFPWFGNQILLIVLGLSLIFATQFARLICNAKTLAPGVDRFCGVLMRCMIPLTLLSPLLDYSIMTAVFSAIAMIVVLSSLAVGAVGAWRGSVSARYFMIAWITLMCTVVIYIFKTFGLLPHNSFTHSAFQVGALIEMVLLSLALGARVNEIQKRSYIDDLSGLHNRRFFDEHLQREFRLSERNGTPLSLLVLDLDHFKAINDRYGHRQGDLTIRGIGQLIMHEVRKPVVACRYGGEEFAVLLPRTDQDAAQRVAEHLLRRVAELDLGNLSVTVSIGVASYKDGNYGAGIQLFEAADAALYRAKQTGRNKVVVESVQQLDMAPV
ncbi:diguanylate cyclase [Microbulbifer celer]|uniref:diguanylate cyclase n=1 Tax=Microbulbifer celer TaxID=435905 RepID=A0ABW3U950_9GAMM|nr:diguanylate cyclase [Microbulbifer celer]UFN57537.1 sensor domain-containing diguanylate cyclase [Microbulbifer celer]